MRHSWMGLLLLGLLPVAGVAQDAGPWRTGGSLGVYDVSGDLKAGTGFGGELSSRHRWPSAISLGVFAQGSSHGVKGLDNRLGVISFGPEIRSTRRQEKGPYLGFRGHLGLWETEVPNPLTLEYTSVNAFGQGLGVIAGVSGPAWPPLWDMALEVSLTWMSYGDAGTEAYSFAGTDSSAKVLSVSLGFYRRHRGGG